MLARHPTATPAGGFAVLAALTACGDDGPLFEVRPPDAAAPRATPVLIPAPAVLDFGWVQPGRARVRRVRWVVEDPDAEVRVTAARVTGPDAAAFALVDPAALPQTVTGRAGRVDPAFSLAVRVEPRAARPLRAELRLESAEGTSRPVALRADGRGPPGVHVWPETVELGPLQPEAQLGLRNSGEAELWAELQPPRWDGPRVDTPEAVQLAPGAVTHLPVRAAVGPAGRWRGALALRTNVPGRAEVVVPLRVERPDAPGAAFTLDLLADDRSGPLNLDPWRVQLAIEGPDGARALVGGLEGPRADASGATEGPGRVAATAFGDPARAHRIRGMLPLAAGTYRVEATYLDDCRAAPTALVAGAAGWTVEALLAAWLGGSGGRATGLDEALAAACVERGPLEVALRVRVDGRDVAGPSARLRSRGDRWRPGRLQVGDRVAWEGTP